MAFVNLSAFIEILVTIGVVLGILLAIVAILTQRAVSGQFNFMPKAMAFKGKNESDHWSWSNVWHKVIGRTRKSFLKASLLVGVAAVILYSQAATILQLPFRSLAQSIASISAIYPKVLGGMLLVLAVIAFIDFIYQRHVHTKSLKMSKQVKKTRISKPIPRGRQNSSDADGKSANAARQTAALDDVASATAVITNPTHFAVALKYDVGSPDAPKILAMGGVIWRHKLSNGQTMRK